jgi:hypothetical protein
MRFCVQVKNKPCKRCTSYMRLISWTHPLGSKTIIRYAKFGGVRNCVKVRKFMNMNNGIKLSKPFIAIVLSSKSAVKTVALLS